MSGTYSSANFNVGKDASGDVLVTYAATAANAAIDEAGGGSLADLLGRYDSQFPMPIAETHHAFAGLESLLPPVLGAETYTGVVPEQIEVASPSHNVDASMTVVLGFPSKKLNAANALVYEAQGLLVGQKLPPKLTSCCQV